MNDEARARQLAERNETNLLRWHTKVFGPDVGPILSRGFSLVPSSVGRFPPNWSWAISATLAMRGVCQLSGTCSIEVIP